MTPEQIEAICDRLAKPGRESSQQVAFFAWLSFVQDVYPFALMTYAIPNGAMLGDDAEKRAIRGSRLKAEGLRAGVPDICYPVPVWGRHSLYIEMKKDGGVISADQTRWISTLLAQHHAVTVCYNWRAARKAFIDYNLGIAIKLNYR